MISTEIVQSVENGRIITNKGVRRAAGNALIRVGSAVTVMGDMVIGWRRRAGYVPGATVPAFGYKFASGTTMYYTDLDFNILSEESITPPVEGAVLRLHCYNSDVEYFVWFAGTSCIIQKDGETIATFTAPYEVYDCDATLSGENLIWVARYQDWETGNAYLARYVNSEAVYILNVAEWLPAISSGVVAENLARFNSLVDGVKSTPITRTDTYSEAWDGPDYDRTYEALLWQESQRNSSEDKGIGDYDMWAGRASYYAQAIESVFLQHNRKTTLYNNESSSSPDNPWVTIATICGPYYYFAEYQKKITTDNILLYSDVRVYGPEINWYYGAAQDNNGLLDGSQTLIDTREELPQRKFAFDISKISFISQPETKDETHETELDPTTIFSFGSWAVQRRSDGVSPQFWLMENGVDVLENYKLEGAGFAVEGDTLVVVNTWWIFKKKVGEDAEYFDAYIPGQATKRFTEVTIRSK